MINSPRAVIDIGSNAIRLVVYGGPPRAPMPIYNEKARIALGESVERTGGIAANIMTEAIATLIRFDALTKAMKVDQRRIVATEATRRADNGPEFLAKANHAGIKIELMSGEQEALASALGVICDMPWAIGYVADQGGGSLELAQLVNGEPQQPVSMPFGTIPLSKREMIDPKILSEEMVQLISDRGSFCVQKGLPMHLVGGAWRMLGQLHMHVIDYPLSILSNYSMPVEALSDLSDIVQDRQLMESTGVVSGTRIGSMPAALGALQALVRIFKPSEMVVSVYGLREGLLFDRLSQQARTEDPLIAAARHEGARLSRFAYHGDRIAEWIEPLFRDDPPSMQRLRHAVCLLADSVWNSHPEYRAQHAAALALEGNWPGVTASDRAVMANALFAAYGGFKTRLPMVSELATPELLARSKLWGLAIRLAQRLDGGTGIGLAEARLQTIGGRVELLYDDACKQLDAATVRKRLKHLNDAFTVDTARKA